METVKVDDKKRVRLPDAKPGQVLAYEVSGETFTLTLVKKVEPNGRPSKFKLVMKKGRPVIQTDRVVSLETIKELLTELP
ncbi:MAG TPA: hypothetical protein VFB72_10940 [Verrucomicrobiae bacterium]|nr:hypothetical protein [Verrucomicrobiae bacterium]